MDATRLAVALSHANVGAFLRVLRQGESSQGDDAYTIINGGAHFSSFDAHPFGELPTTRGGRAAGAYQFLPTTWADLRRRYPWALPDFAPRSQDAGAVLLINDRGALDAVMAGRIETAIGKLRPTWTSLPGASENSGRYTMARALDVYRQHGGRLAADQSDTQPAAPIEERGVPYVPPEPQQEAPMPALMALAQILFSAFTPVAQTYISEKINKATRSGDPAVGQGVAKAAIDAAQQVLKIPDLPTPEATAAAVVAAAQQNPDAIQAAEKASVDYLEKIAPLLDKIAAHDLAVWDAEVRGQDAAAERGRADGENDIAPMLVRAVLGLITLSLTFMFGIMALQTLYSAQHEPSTAMLTLAGPLIGTIFSGLGMMLAYRFGTTRNNSLKDLTVEQLSRRK